MKLRIGQAPPMDLLEKMATYVRVVEAGNFSSAARQLRISAAAVSRQVATLEDELRITLLSRSTRKMAMTAFGRSYYERCLRVLREVEEAQAIGRRDAVDGLLQISAPVGFGLARVVPHVRSLMTKHPRLRLDLRLEDRLVDLVLEGVDVVIRVGSAAPESSELVAHKLPSFRRVLVASPAYLRRRGAPASPEALAKHDVLTQAHTGEGWTLSNGEREARLRPSFMVRSNALDALRELAVQGVGIALLPDWLVADNVVRKEMRIVLPGWQTEAVPVSVIHRTAHRGAPRVRAVVEHLSLAHAADQARGAHSGRAKSRLA